MRRIYMDNGATSFPKAPGVGDSIKHYIEDVGCSINRSGYNSSLSAEEVVFDTRERIVGLFNCNRPENVVFTMNVTQSMNFLLKGLLKPGDHCLVSSMEHNAVMRPLMQLTAIGVEFSRIHCDRYGRLNPQDISSHIKPNTKALILTHASNVCGTILPVVDAGRICRQTGLIFIVDSAQTAGILDVDMQLMNADAIAFTGHKGLLGPQGIGGFVITDRLAAAMDSLIAGGTGSLSEHEEQPPYMPDKFEAGTPNIPGIFGLNTALKYIHDTGIHNIREKEMKLAGLFLDGLKCINGVELIGLPSIDGCNGFGRRATDEGCNGADRRTMAGGCADTDLRKMDNGYRIGAERRDGRTDANQRATDAGCNAGNRRSTADGCTDVNRRIADDGKTDDNRHTLDDGCTSAYRYTAMAEAASRTAVISVDFPALDNAMVAYSLDKDYGIRTRCGLHCAPSAHRTLGTFPQGTVRFSLGHFNTEEEVVYTLDSIEKLLRAY
jgi:selenocysteine lyase/cysteine desulfurase